MDKQEYTYLNRDLSWLSFNHRVLMEAADDSIPLYSRISFLSIFSSNLDEFFRVRMPSIYALTSIKAKKTTLREEYPKDMLQQVKESVQHHLSDFGRILKEQIIPGLKNEHIRLYYGEAVLEEHKETVSDYFLSKVLSFLQPVILTEDNQDKIFLENNHLYFIVDLEPINQPGTDIKVLLNIPSEHLERFTELSKIGDNYFILFLDDVVRENLKEVFPGFIVKGAYSVKMTRDAEMNIVDEFIGDIAEKFIKIRRKD